MHAHAYTFPATASLALNPLFICQPLTPYTSIYILAIALTRHTTHHATMTGFEIALTVFAISGAALPLVASAYSMITDGTLT
jgi:hypothetical protein